MGKMNDNSNPCNDKKWKKQTKQKDDQADSVAASLGAFFAGSVGAVGLLMACTVKSTDMRGFSRGLPRFLFLLQASATIALIWPFRFSIKLCQPPPAQPGHYQRGPVLLGPRGPRGCLSLETGQGPSLKGWVRTAMMGTGVHPSLTPNRHATSPGHSCICIWSGTPTWLPHGPIRSHIKHYYCCRTTGCIKEVHP